MKKLGLITALLTLMVFVLSVDSYSGQGLMSRKGPDGWGPGSSYGAMYDLSTVGTVTGKVVSIDTFVPPGGKYGGVHVMLATGMGVVSVHLGPKWFIINQDFELNPGDLMAVTGSRVTYDGKPAIIASNIKKEDSELLLRDENGIPYWAAYRRR